MRTWAERKRRNIGPGRWDGGTADLQVVEEAARAGVVEPHVAGVGPGGEEPRPVRVEGGARDDAALPRRLPVRTLEGAQRRMLAPRSLDVVNANAVVEAAIKTTRTGIVKAK